MTMTKTFRLMVLVGMSALVAAGPVAAQAPVPPQAPAAAPAQAAEKTLTAQEKQIREGYVLGSDDIVEVDVLGQPEFKTRARIRANGTIALPFIGDIAATGLTSLTFGEAVAAKLRAGGYYSKPIVSVDIVGFASRYVVVLGDVTSPGLQPVDRAYRVSEVIARAGGMRESGADYVIVRKVDGGELRLPFEKLAAGDASEDPFVTPGDKIYVPAAELFYIYGQVNAPGAYPIKGGMTLRKGLARGGGLTASGSEKRVKVYHDGKEIKATLDREIQAGDVVVVGERLF